jgi:hypothetical protein
MKRNHYVLAALLSASVLFSCQKLAPRQDAATERSRQSTTSTLTGTSNTFTSCGVPTVQGLGNPLGEFATVTITNDATNAYIVFTAENGYLLQQASGILGNLSHLETVLAGSNDLTVGPTPPDFIQNLSPEAGSYTFTIPRNGFSGCVFIDAHAVLVKKDAAGNITDTQYAWVLTTNNINSYPFSTYFEYCTQDCPPPPPPGDCGQLRTETPGGWGAVPNGNNPGTYLHAKFAAAFPGGVQVGCYPSNYYISLTTAQAITDLLPTGGTPAALKGSSTNPPAIKNELVGQLVALTLSVGFDDSDPSFGPAGVALGDMNIGSGIFSGWTVRNFLAEANKVLGGCSTNYTPSQVNGVADLINKNYDDGLVDNGFLVCPK